MAQEEAPRGAPVPKNVKKRDKSSKKINLRLVVQIFFFALIALIAVNHALEEQGRAIGPVISIAACCLSLWWCRLNLPICHGGDLCT